jgi:hypothetical protein
MLVYYYYYYYYYYYWNYYYFISIFFRREALSPDSPSGARQNPVTVGHPLCCFVCGGPAVLRVCVCVGC